MEKMEEFFLVEARGEELMKRETLIFFFLGQATFLIWDPKWELKRKKKRKDRNEEDD